MSYPRFLLKTPIVYVHSHSCLSRLHQHAPHSAVIYLHLYQKHVHSFWPHRSKSKRHDGLRESFAWGGLMYVEETHIVSGIKRKIMNIPNGDRYFKTRRLIVSIF